MTASTSTPSIHEQHHPEPPFNWRAYLPVHPAAELFPPLPEDELRESSEDIRINGLRVPAVTWAAKEGDEPQLLDGRNRLNALAMLGLLYETDGHLQLRSWTGTKWAELSGDRVQFQHLVGGDPYDIALSFNVHRRHLKAKQKRELIAKVLKAQPEASNLSIAKQVKADDKTVAQVRRKLEANSEFPNKTDRHEASGRKARGRKAKKIAEAGVVGDTKDDAEQRKAAQAAAEKAAVSPADTALAEFDGLVGRLLQKARKAEPKRFDRTGFHSDELVRLSDFLAKVAAARLVAAVKRPPPPPPPRDPLKVNWRGLGADDLEDAIRNAQQYGVDHAADEDHAHQQDRLKQIDRMRKLLVELRSAESAVEMATRH